MHTSDGSTEANDQPVTNLDVVAYVVSMITYIGIVIIGVMLHKIVSLDPLQGVRADYTFPLIVIVVGAAMTISMLVKTIRLIIKKQSQAPPTPQ